MASTITTTASGAQTASLRPRSRATGSGAAPASSGGAGRTAPYPVDLITPISSGASRPPSAVNKPAPWRS